MLELVLASEYLLVLAFGGVLAAEFLFSSATPGVVEEWQRRRDNIYERDSARAGAVPPTPEPSTLR